MWGAKEYLEKNGWQSRIDRNIMTFVEPAFYEYYHQHHGDKWLSEKEAVWIQRMDDDIKKGIERA